MEVLPFVTSNNLLAMLVREVSPWFCSYISRDRRTDGILWVDIYLNLSPFGDRGYQLNRLCVTCWLNFPGSDGRPLNIPFWSLLIVFMMYWRRILIFHLFYDRRPAMPTPRRQNRFGLTRRRNRLVRGIKAVQVVTTTEHAIQAMKGFGFPALLLALIQGLLFHLHMLSDYSGFAVTNTQ